MKTIAIALVPLALAVAWSGVVAARASATRAVEAPYSETATSTCLSAHRVLVTPGTLNGKYVPVGFHALGLLTIAFSLFPGRELDSATLVFEPDPAAAKHGKAILDAWTLTHRYGLPRPAMQKRIAASEQLLGNVIVLWAGTRGKPASRSALVACLTS